MASRSDIEAGRAFVRLYVNNTDFVNGLRNGKRLLGEFATSLEIIGRRMSGLGIAMLTPIGLAIREWGKFDDVMRTVKAVSESTTEQMETMSEQALELASSLGFSAVSVGALMLELVRAGVAADGIGQATEAVLNLARATGTDPARAAAVLNRTLNQFGLGAEYTTDVADKLTVTANQTLSTVESLGDALHYAGTVAKDFALPHMGGDALNDLLALIGGLHQLGLHGELAGTSMRRLYVLTASEAKDMTKILGVEFRKGMGTKSLIQALGEVDKKLSGLSITDKAAKLHKAFGILGITGASGIGKMTLSLQKLRENIANVDNESRKQAEEINAGIGGAFRRFWANLGVLGIRIGKVFNKEVKEALDSVSRFMTRIGTLVVANKDVVWTFTKWGLVITGVGGALLGLGLFINVVSSAVGGLLGMFAIFGVGTGMFTRSVGRVAAGSRMMGMAFEAAILRMTRAVASLNTNTQRLLAGPVPQLSAVLRAIAGGVASGVTSLASTLAPSPRSMVLMRSFFRGMADLNAWIVPMRGIRGEWWLLGNTIQFTANELLQFVLGGRTVMGMLRGVGSGISGILSSPVLHRGFFNLGSVAGAAANRIMQAFRRAAVYSVDIMAGAAYRIGRGMVRGTRAGISGLFSILTQVGLSLGGALGGTLGAASGLLLIGPSLLGLLNPAVLLVATIVGGAIAWVKFTDAGARAFTTLKGFIEPLVELGKKMVQGITDAFSAGDLQLAGQIAMAGLKAILLTGFADIVSGIGGAWGEGLGGLADALLSGNFVKAWTIFLGILDLGWASFCNSLVSYFIKAVRALLPYWRSTVDRMGQWIYEMDMILDPAGSAATEKIKEMWLNQELLRKRQKQVTELEAEEKSGTITPKNKAYLERLKQEIAKSPYNTDLPDIGGEDWLDRAARGVRKLETAVGKAAGMTPAEIEENIKARLDELESGTLPKLEEAARRAKVALAEVASGGSKAAKERAAKAREELDKLVVEAETKAAAARAAAAKKEADEVKRLTDAGAGGDPGAGSGTLAPAKGTLITFSALEAKYSAQSGSLESIVADDTRRTRIAGERTAALMREEIELFAAYLSTMRVAV